MPKIAAKDRDAYYEKRRSELLDAALRLLARQSYDGTSVAAIAREAGMSKGTFYLYFQTKEELIEALIERFSLLPDFQQVARAAAGQPLENVLRLAVPVLYERLKQRTEVIGLLLREGATRPANARIFLERVLLPSNRIAAELLEGAVGPERASELDCLVAARALVGMLLVFVVSQEVLGGRELLPIDDTKITDTIIEVFLHGALGERHAS